MPAVFIWLWKVIGPTRFVGAVIATVMAFVLFIGVVTIGLAAMTKDPNANQMNCSGVAWDTPYELEGVNYIERFGEWAKKLSDGDNDPEDVALFLRAITDTLNLWSDALFASAFGDARANESVTGWRNADDEARDKALRYCCVELRKWNDQNDVPQPALPDPPVAPPPPANDPPPFDPKTASFQRTRPTPFSAATLERAAIVRQVAVDNDLGERAVLIAYMTVFVESEWRIPNEAQSDRDSAGLFQQRRPWGPLSARMDPTQSAEMFFNGGRGGQPGLLDKANWETRPMGEAAQSVQVSAFPGKYAKREGEARQLLAALGGTKATSKARVSKSGVVKAPQFDPRVPLASYCAQLEKFDTSTGARTPDVPAVDPSLKDPGGREYNLGPVKPAARRGAYLLGHKFDVKVIGGVRADPIPDHPSGRAIDLMTTVPQGTALADYAKAHARELSIEYIIWNQRIWSVARAGEGWRHMADRGSVSANHKDHVHITFKQGAPA